MKYRVTIHKPVNPLTFVMDITPDQMRLLERWLVAGQPNAVSYETIRGTNYHANCQSCTCRDPEAYQPEPDIPWPIGPTLEDM